MKSRILPFQTLLSFQTLPTTLLPFQTLPFQTQILVRLQARLPFQTLPTTLREERKWMSRRAWPRASVSGGAAGPPFALSFPGDFRELDHLRTGELVALSSPPFKVGSHGPFL